MSNIKVDIVQEMMPFCIQKVSKREGPFSVYDSAMLAVDYANALIEALKDKSDLHRRFATKMLPIASKQIDDRNSAAYRVLGSYEVKQPIKRSAELAVSFADSMVIAVDEGNLND
ncbi:hypothetical protein KTH76_04750 [Acinetobacter baumannii]|nr:hypothetical protein [Acinetobacter baumannii]